MSTDKSRELELLVLQFLYEENLGDTAHMLEQESGCFFNMKYFGDQVLAGNLDDADSYLLGFTRIEDNKFSRKIFFQLRKHKYLEALDRENKELSTYGGATSARKTMFQELIKLVVKNPQLNNKLEIQNVEPYRLRYLINQSKNWQHQHWKNQRSNLGTQIPQEVLLVPIAMPAPLQHDAPPSISNSLSLTVYPNPPISHSAAAAGAVNYLPENEGFLTCSRRSLANSTGINYQCVNSENARKRSRIVTVDENNFDNKQAADVKERIQDEDVNKIEDRKLADVSNSVPCRSFKLPDPKSMGKIVQLLYKNSGSDVLALASNTAHKIWKWTCNNKCSIFARTARNPGKAISCIALSNNDQFLLSASGGVVSIVNMITFKTAKHDKLANNLKELYDMNLETLLTSSPAAAVFSFYPNDGLKDKNIPIFYLKLSKKVMLEGHQKKITGLLCAWNIDGWEKHRETIVSPHKEGSPSPVGISNIQFHKDQIHLLAVKESQLAVYCAWILEQMCRWEPKDSMATPISNATCSCDSHLVYTSFCDGEVGVFDADVLMPYCDIPPYAFLPSRTRSGNVYPLAIAAHPLEPHQFAIGMTDGGIYLTEPLESQDKRVVGSRENEPVSSDPAIINHGSESQG